MIDRIIRELGGVRGGKGYMCFCPAHDDANRSLSVTLSEGRLLVHCHTGCSQEAVIAALRERGLWPGAERQQSDRRAAPLVNDKGNAKGGTVPERRIVATYDYRDEQGELLYQVCRYEPKGFRQRRPDGRSGWTWNLQDTTRVLYGLPKMLRADATEPVFITEGEKDADRLAALGLIATCNPGGVGKWRSEYVEAFGDRNVIVLPHNDAPGRKHAEQVAQSLQGVTKTVKVLPLPGLSEKGDLSDWADAGGTVEQLQKLVNSTPEYVPASDDDAGGAASGGKKKRAPSQADTLVKLAQAADLFHTPGGIDSEGFATITIGSHCETWPIKSKGFVRWLAHQFYAVADKTPSSQSMQDALSVIAGRAIYDGFERDVYVRIAESDGTIYLDLADAEWRVVKVAPDGWCVVTSDAIPVRFVRKYGMLALPTPVTGGDISELRRFVNLPDNDMWTLFVVWLVAAMRPSGPYPIVVLSGEQGSAKSTLCRVARLLIDPNKAPLRRPPRDDRDIMIAASNGWVVAFDNLSRITPALSDVLCTLATGGGFATRELYSDDDEKLFDAMRPIILNGIDDLATRPDLLDRAIALTLPTIDEANVRTETDLWRDFEAARPAILGALLSAASAALRNVRGVKLDRLPRMADFAVWATAAEPALGWETGRFMAAYDGNRESANELAIESSPVGPAIVGMMHHRERWAGTASELLTELEDHHTDEKTRKRRGWPKGPPAMGGAVRRIARNLRSFGMRVSFDRKPGGSRRRLIELELVGKTSSRPSRPSPSYADATEKPVPPARSRDGRDHRATTDRPAETLDSGAPEPIRDDRDGRDSKPPTHSGGIACNEVDGDWGEV